MPQGAPAAAVGQAAGQPEQAQQGKSTFGKILQMVAMWVAMQFVMKQFFPSQNGPKITTDADGKMVEVPANTGNIPAYQLRPSKLDEGATYNPLPQRIAPMWPEPNKVDIIVTVSDSFIPTPLFSVSRDMIVFEEKDFGLGNFSDKRVHETTIAVPESVQRNGTLWGHFYVGLPGSVLDPEQKGFDPATAYHFIYPFTQYIPKKKEKKLKSLLGKKDEAKLEIEDKDEETESSGPVVGNYFHPNTSLSFVPGMSVLGLSQTHVAIRQFLHLESTGARDGSGQNSWYYPILFVNTFWQLKAHMTQINETVKTLPIRIDLNNLAPWKFQTMASIELSARESARTAAYGGSLPGGGDGTEIEMVKEILLDTNPILLAITSVVTVLHLIFETLAFTSDVQHYRKKKDNIGISVRSILANVFMQAVIFLYLVDNSQNTSWMILGSQGVGILIELWKVTTVVNVRVRAAPQGALIPYHITFEDKHKLSETEERTKEYDEIAFKYMYMAGVPLLLAYAVYSVIYDEHKSWYSFIITTLVGSVYAYGFLMMVPALYINYRLKSVAHMPAKAMTYKFLNTFIDDLFAFTIKMPILHRLATFRDDIIFFVYIYQRWAYRVDYTRVNEFGQGGEDDAPEQVNKDKSKSLPPAVPDTGKTAVSSSVAEGATGSDVRSGKANKRK